MKMWLKSYKNQTKERINIMAIIYNLAPSLGEEGTRTVEDLKRQIVLMEDENKKLFNKEKKNIFQGSFPKKKTLRLCLK